MYVSWFQDPGKAFEAEWESLEIAEHHWALKNIESECMKEYSQNLQIYANFKDKEA